MDRLVALCAGVAIVGFCTEDWWELGKAVTRVHFDAIVSATTRVGWFESTVIGGAMESEKFVKAVA